MLFDCWTRECAPPQLSGFAHAFILLQHAVSGLTICFVKVACCKVERCQTVQLSLMNLADAVRQVALHRMGRLVPDQQFALCQWHGCFVGWMELLERLVPARMRLGKTLPALIQEQLGQILLRRAANRLGEIERKNVGAFLLLLASPIRPFKHEGMFFRPLASVLSWTGVPSFASLRVPLVSLCTSCFFPPLFVSSFLFRWQTHGLLLC